LGMTLFRTLWRLWLGLIAFASTYLFARGLLRESRGVVWLLVVIPIVCVALYGRSIRNEVLEQVERRYGPPASKPPRVTDGRTCDAETPENEEHTDADEGQSV